MAWPADTILWCVNIDENLCFCTCEEPEAKFWTAGGSVLSGCPPGVGPWMLWETDGVWVDVITVGPWMPTMVIIIIILITPLHYHYDDHQHDVSDRHHHLELPSFGHEMHVNKQETKVRCFTCLLPYRDSIQEPSNKPLVLMGSHLAKSL